MPQDPSLLSGIDPVDPDPNADPNAVPNPDPNADPAGDPGADPNADPAAAELPKSPEELQAAIDKALEDAEGKRREGVPEKPDDYTVPAIEGVDTEELTGSNVFKTMRAAAHDAGMPQAKFDEFVQAWAAAETEEVNAYRTEQMSLLGSDEAQVKTRLGTLAGGLQRMLPKDEAEALMGAAASAGVVKALERLLSKSPTPRTPPPNEQKDDALTIKKLMESDAYMGREDQRDPTVVARVDAFFAAGGSIKG